MGCCGSKPVEDERKPLLQEQKKPRPVISEPVFVHSSSSIPSSPIQGEPRLEAGSTSIQGAGGSGSAVAGFLPRQESVSSFADYDVLKRMKGFFSFFLKKFFAATFSRRCLSFHMAPLSSPLQRSTVILRCTMMSWSSRRVR